VQAPLRVLYAASECAPLTKTGGLADVAGALPRALRSLGIDVRVLIPGYREVYAGLAGAHRVARVDSLGYFPAAELIEATNAGGVPLLVLACPELYERDGGPYLDANGIDWPDNALRFGFFSRVAALLASTGSPYAWTCDVLHCNDWQTGLAPAYLRFQSDPHASTLLTVHNLAYQGIFGPSMVSSLGLPPQSFAMHGVEYYGNLSFLKAGLFYADRLSTVSPTYAREIQAEPLGFGLHGLLADRGAELEGILNGIDTVAWSAATDHALTARYDAHSLDRKALNKQALRARFGLDPRPDAPLLGIVSRLIPQKGIDLVVAAARRIVQLPAQLVVLGTGEASIERDLASLAASHPGTIAFMRGFDEALSHEIEAGADIFLMPSRFEPCGLNQMYSQRYGTPPVVRRTGGLADSVVDCTPTALESGTGFVFEDATPDALYAAIERAVDAWRMPETWRRIQRNGMTRDFSWTASAQRYLALYQDMSLEGT